jgi:hypothetical protein
MPFAVFPALSTRSGLAKWAQWIALTIAGVSLGWALSGAFRFEEVAALLLLPGLSRGIAQWQFFRPLPKAILWLAPATLTSPVLGLVVLSMLGRSYPPELDPPLYARVAVSSLLLALIGLSEFFVLRRWFLHAGLWIPTVTIAWLIAFLLLQAVQAALPETTYASPSYSTSSAVLQLGLIGAFLGAIQATITGALIAYLEPRQIPGA